ncbi:uncharacterized protein [Engystomops pustulosus]|uniref:uncharacterized protein n=1 Tax=Engystomops pustulosus TaxID=76066 RepID=UPI003AFA8ED6
MATIYKRQSKEALVHLCEQRGIDPADKSKELLVCALMEQDAEQGSGTAQGSQEMDINPGRVSPEATHSRSPQEGMDVSLQMALQQLGECDPSLRLQLILQFNQAAAAREERAAREKERAAAEREKERAAAEREERAAAERQADREFRLEMARIERGINSVQPQSQDVDPKRPRQERFPVLDKDGDLDIFLRSFEKTCRQYHLPREQWAQYLSPGLRGKALEVFADLPLELDEDYDAIKAALIKKYNLTPEVYRKKFRSVKRETTDSYADTVGNLRTTFLQWTRGLSVNSREDLEDLMIKDQFLHICPVDVRQFVCDREPKTADEAAQIADSYTANRMPEAKRETSPQRSSSWKEKQARTTSQPSVSKVGENITLRESINQGDMRKCFNCNKVGHLRSACPERGATVYSTVPVVMLLSGDMEKLQHHMQTVIVGDRVTQGLRDSGASYSLVRPEIINPEDIIPEKTLPVKGITGCHPGVPVAKVFMDWGSGRGIRLVGVSQELPVDVLLGNDLGNMTTVYVPDGISPLDLVWDTAKSFIRGIFKAQIHRYKKVTQKDTQDLEKKIQSLEEKYMTDPSEQNRVNWEEAQNLHSDLIQAQANKKMGVYARKGYIEANLPGRMLANLIKEEKKRVIIKSIEGPGSGILHRPEDIQKAFVEYYEELFESKSTMTGEQLRKYLSQISLPCLSAEERALLEAPITHEEINGRDSV